MECSSCSGPVRGILAPAGEGRQRGACGLAPAFGEDEVERAVIRQGVDGGKPRGVEARADGEGSGVMRKPAVEIACPEAEAVAGIVPAEERGKVVGDAGGNVGDHRGRQVGAFRPQALKRGAAGAVAEDGSGAVRSLRASICRSRRAKCRRRRAG